MTKRYSGKILAWMLCLAMALGVLTGIMPGAMSTAKADGEATFIV